MIQQIKFTTQDVQIKHDRTAQTMLNNLYQLFSKKDVVDHFPICPLLLSEDCRHPSLCSEYRECIGDCDTYVEPPEPEPPIDEDEDVEKGEDNGYEINEVEDEGVEKDEDNGYEIDEDEGVEEY